MLSVLDLTNNWQARLGGFGCRGVWGRYSLLGGYGLQDFENPLPMTGSAFEVREAWTVLRCRTLTFFKQKINVIPCPAEPGSSLGG